VMADVEVPDEHKADAVAREAIGFVIPRTRAAAAGADDALRTLAGPNDEIVFEPRPHRTWLRRPSCHARSADPGERGGE
jgi:hypothetical protein